jgi:hypothetical protein
MVKAVQFMFLSHSADYKDDLLHFRPLHHCSIISSRNYALAVLNQCLVATAHLYCSILSFGARGTRLIDTNETCFRAVNSLEFGDHFVDPYLCLHSARMPASTSFSLNLAMPLCWCRSERTYKHCSDFVQYPSCLTASNSVQRAVSSKQYRWFFYAACEAKAS